MKFQLVSKYKPAGDQGKAIKELVENVNKGMQFQTLLGATGTGKTYVMAQVIEKTQRPTLVIAHNKTLAAQLCSELRTLFPHNAVEYFVSYYDYYQPEAYMPGSDTYIEKEAMINDEIDRLRHSATQAILTRRDTIIVASVSCIYNLGSSEEYERGALKLVEGMEMTRDNVMKFLVEAQFERTNADVLRAQFRVRGDVFEVHGAESASHIYRFSVEGGRVHELEVIDPITRKTIEERETLYIFPARHYVAPPEVRETAIASIKKELKERLAFFNKNGLLLEAERLERRTKNDISMIAQLGMCHGIENYSRHFDGRESGAAPNTLISFFPDDFITIIDESHVSVPQIGGMSEGDKARKKTLIEYGFRLPSAIDNRPLRFAEFEHLIKQTIFVSATPGNYERAQSAHIAEMIVRPTGLVDPELILHGSKGQIEDLFARIDIVVDREERALVTTLTKKMAEDLTEYINTEGKKRKRKIKAVYVHSDVDTVDRLKILTEFRRGTYDVLVGVNLLREGLDLPEVSLVAIIDADKEGFLRSDTSLIQTIGRAARNVNGQVVLYADTITGSMKRAMDETERRREKQLAYNEKHGITPKTIIKNIVDYSEEFGLSEDPQGKLGNIKDVIAFEEVGEQDKTVEERIKIKEKQMKEASSQLQFEVAAILRDEIRELQKKLSKQGKEAKQRVRTTKKK